MTVPANFDDLVDEPENFTTAKFRLLDAISMDPRVSHGEFRTAFRLMQHANAATGAIFPSQERIADQIGVRTRQVREYIAGLVTKRWLHISRPNRQKSNRYSFDLRNENAVLDRQLTLAEARAEVRAERRFSTSQKLLTGAKLPVPRGEIPPVQRGDISPPNTLMEHPKGTPKGNT